MLHGVLVHNFFRFQLLIQFLVITTLIGCFLNYISCGLREDLNPHFFLNLLSHRDHPLWIGTTFHSLLCSSQPQFPHHLVWTRWKNPYQRKKVNADSYLVVIMKAKPKISIFFWSFKLQILFLCIGWVLLFGGLSNKIDKMTACKCI